TVRRSSARPAATGAPPATGSTSWASGSAGRLPLEPLLLYLLGPARRADQAYAVIRHFSAGGGLRLRLTRPTKCRVWPFATLRGDAANRSLLERSGHSVTRAHRTGFTSTRPRIVEQI